MSNRRSHYTSTNEDETLLEGTAESAQGFALFVMVCMLIFAVTSYRNNRRVRATTASSATVRNVGTVCCDDWSVHSFVLYIHANTSHIHELIT
jgi:hypothetical protein